MSQAFALQLAAWQKSLQAANKSPHTIRTYRNAVRALADWLPEDVVPVAVTALHIEDFLLDCSSASTAGTHLRGLQQFFKWLARREGSANPTVGVPAPFVAEKPVEVLGADKLAEIFARISGDTFAEIRDTAILRMFLDAGPRRSELATIALADLDFEHGTARVLGKGRRERLIPFGPRTAAALRRYLDVRAAHKHAASGALWLGSRGPMTGDGIYLVVRDRAGVHPHAFRHTFAHQWRMSEGSSEDLMVIAGWRSTRMLSRYGSSAATERALAAHARRSLAEQV